MTALTIASALPVVDLRGLTSDVAAVFEARGITGVDLGHLSALLSAAIPDDVLIDKGHGPKLPPWARPAPAGPVPLRAVDGGAL